MAKGQVSCIVRITGVGDSIRALGKINKTTDKAAGKGIKRALEYFIEQIKKITPVKTGLLKESVQLIFAEQGRNSFGKIIATAPYAIYVHECTWYRHASPTRAKFIESVTTHPIHRKNAQAMILKDIREAQQKIRMRRRSKATGGNSWYASRGGATVKVKMS